MVSLLWSSLVAFAPAALQRGGRLQRESSRVLCRNASASSASVQTRDEKKIMQDILYRVRDVNYMPEEIRQSIIPFRVDGKLLGKIRPAMANRLTQSTGSLPPVFAVETDPQTGTQFLTLNDAVAGRTAASRTQAVAQVMHSLREQGIVTGWRDEEYPIATGFYEPPVFVMERAAVPVLGGLEYGVHINGLVQDDANHAEFNGGGPTPSTKMWMARRSATKSKYPGMLDHIVAGGQPAGMSLMQNVIKECLEEANIPEDLTRAGIRPAGAISYETYNTKQDTISRAVLFNFDLYLPADFQPTPVDGEVQEFFLWTIDQLLESMAEDYHDPIKPNCYSVIIDYLLRAGHLSPEIPGYLDVVRELRSGDCC